MDSKLSIKKLPGVVKSYRKKATNTSQCLRSRHLATISVNATKTLKVVPNHEMVGKLLPKVQSNGMTNRPNRPSPPQALPVVKPTKSTVASLNAGKTRPKLSKWDFKGRLAYTEQDLVVSKNNLKNAASREVELSAELSELLEKERLSRERAEEAVELYDKLVEERDSLVIETGNFEEVAERLKKEVEGLSFELRETWDRLKESKENYKNHGSKMFELSEDIERVKKENCGNEETVESLKKHNKELEIALSGIRDKRQEMIDAIRLLKGDD